ncbi:vitamin K epoxide reductase family protein [Candidatus Saccharibacteria bacterium]|nr:vitamin K epoxide reductase family protein [Candidatus Saccharibacteria bacterium]
MTIINTIKDKFQGKDSPHQSLFAVMLAFGIIGLSASFVLSVEEIHLLKNPDATLSCSINLVLNCATVMQTWQATAFGFPNMFIGLMGFPIVIMIALLGLSRVAFPRWFAIGMELGIVFWTCFAYWLFFNSVYDIQVLCPWCLVVTFTMTMLLAASTFYTIRKNSFGLNSSIHGKLTRFIDKGYYQLLVASWIVLMIALVILKFGDGLFG